MRIHEGADSLKNFMQFFERDTTFRYSLVREAPIIVLLDNDEKAQAAVKFIAGKYPHHAVDYDLKKNLVYHVTRNLFLVVIPTASTKGKPAKGHHSCIEHMFDATTLSKKDASNRAFTLEDNYDPTKFYGKNDFATKIVKPNQKAIDFSGFAQIFTSVDGIIASYKPAP